MKKVLYKNAIFVPMTERGKTYAYMGVTGDTISYLGNEKPSGYKKTVDLQGKFVYPGLCDSHLHLLYSVATCASSLNICRITENGVEPATLKGVEKNIREYCKVNPKENLIVVNQYIASAIEEGRLPFYQELDDWASGIDIVVLSIDGHSCSMSSSLMKKLGIQCTDGILTGSEYDLNQGKITGYIASKVTLSKMVKGMTSFENECFSYGITKVCALEGDDNGTGKDSLLRIIVFLARRMRIKVRLFPQYMDYGVLKTYGKKMLKMRIGGCSRWELDGSVGSHSASFYKPYKDTGLTGELYYQQSMIDDKVKEALSNGYTMTCHAIGTRAIDEIVHAYENCESLIPDKGPMNRIDHFEFPSDYAMDFVRKHRIAVTLQPGYSYLDKRYIKSYERFLPEELIQMQCPLRTMTEEGVVILGSSDSPVQSSSPYDQMRGMMDFYLADQSIDAYEALKTYTYNPHLALDENDGCLSVGNQADFFVCSTDILSTDAVHIGEVRADATYIGGVRMKKQKESVFRILTVLFTKPKKI